MRFLALCMIWALVSCGDSPPEPYPLPENAMNLIAGDSAKTWMLAKRINGKVRMNMGDCFLHYRQTYLQNGSVSDNNSKAKDCGPSLVGQWEITTTEKGNSYIKITSALIPELLNIEEDHKFFQIRYLSEDSLVLKFSHNQFGKKQWITDYLVTESVDVPDRDFHH
ncbi:hypothetical protein [Aureitalea marina]|nr:hypothetical protein [Aureitalea marina]